MKNAVTSRQRRKGEVGVVMPLKDQIVSSIFAHIAYFGCGAVIKQPILMVSNFINAESETNISKAVNLVKNFCVKNFNFI